MMAALAPSSPGLRPALPPAYRLVSLREGGDAFAEAVRRAPAGGAGTFVVVGRFDVLDFAVVLEPDEPLVSARRAVFAGMAAVADALSAAAPPEKPLALVWPTTILCDGARLGGGRLEWPRDCREDEVPAWLVFGGMLLAAKAGGPDPGLNTAATWLSEEGFEPADIAIVESFARHLLLAFDTWSERGFSAVAEAYLAWLPKGPGEGTRALDDNGDLLVRHDRGLERRLLLPLLAEAAWHDPATRLPRI
jgi:biotin-(acetyl-CoA carboxylase) ligase